MKRMTILFAAALMTLTSGCATILRGNEESLNIQSLPSEARVETSTGLSCGATPCSMMVPRNTTMTVTITKAGCKPKTVQVTSKMADDALIYIAGNVIFFGGIVGLIVDGVGGALSEVTPNPISVNLDC